MKTPFLIVSCFLLWLQGCAPVPVAPPPTTVIAVEDRRFATRGPSYVVNGRQWVWVNGRWVNRPNRVWVNGRWVNRNGQRVWVNGRWVTRNQRVWVQGRYVRR